MAMSSSNAAETVHQVCAECVQYTLDCVLLFRDRVHDTVIYQKFRRVDAHDKLYPVYL